MPDIDRALCRKTARECIELARTARDPEKKQLLLTRAQEWLKLAYAEHNTELERLLAEFNRQQMGFRKQRRVPARRTSMQQQPTQQQQTQQQQTQQQQTQQQQSKIKPRDKK